ncbi:phosphorylase Pnp/Udp family protein [Streptococcus pneumoniae]|nr:hypothetical protein [Streptococcus pneumoniae]SNJ77642.1 phosphorylase Pnp/Udp family protein [Streptococcus pneumoniae]
MIQKHAIPILEFDDNPQAVIMPNHEGLDLQLPKKCVYAFLGEEIDRYAREVGANCVGEFVSATKTYPVYVINYKGEEVCLAQAPVGSAPAAQFMDWLIGYGVEQIISTGTCGVLANHALSKERSKVENIFAKVKTFKMFSTTYRNHRKRFGLRMNLIAGIINHELGF